ncbi:glycosyltransferase family 2 protein [Nostoc sp. 106C]|uniref:glycosyltransferase n=1 Tax=Nostoc sp. 106C TaxID=1932667 RepID=UPI000A3A309C|nr:glycosyltransferase family 2 protein [Nostoc sp. 106C]OUL23363.1 glycoside hydrolase family 2 protein [Nostoc sp. 106C]
MSANTPSISVIIPTHNRCQSLKRILNALQTQSYPLNRIEVIVVADGCIDGTIEMLKEYQAPYALRFLEQPGKGAGSARNQGATLATGSLFLFLDDDIEPSVHLVEAHVSAHYQPNRVVIGYLPPSLQSQSSFFHISLWAWWEEKFQTMRQLGHRYTYEDLLSGNFSLPAELFKLVGGFDTTFKCREDYELGARLIKVGSDFIFAPDALGYHRDEVTNIDRSLQRKRQEGRADVLFGQRHPDLMYKLRLSYFGDALSLIDYIFLFLAFQIPAVSDLLAAGLRQLLNLLEWLRIRSLWLELNNRLHGYWYLRGIVDQLKTHKALTNLLQSGLIRLDRKDTELELDLQQGLIAAEQLLDKTRPMSVRIRYGQKFVGLIPPQAGVEKLRGVHLRPILATTLSLPLMQALAFEGVLDKEIDKKAEVSNYLIEPVKIM